MTIRELFHSVSNTHNLITVGAGVTKELAQECLDDTGLSLNLREKLNKIIKNLDKMTADAQRGDKELKEIHDRVYALIDPDKEYTDKSK